MRAPQARRRVLLSCPDGVTGAALLQALRRGDRRALARAITLVESSRPDHRGEAERITEALLPETGKAERIGISGPPGAGKSTFIERFGLAGIALGRRIAVLAVDPASKRGGGAILGDKTRMAELARAPEAFIRPSSAGDSRGGITRRTREASLVCEAAGFDAILVETVGVGQAETAVADIVDMFVLILPPAGGDELQGIKLGIVELADLVLVNKADGELAAAAHRTTADYASAVGLVRPLLPEWQVPVRAISALEGPRLASQWVLVRGAAWRENVWSPARAFRSDTTSAIPISRRSAGFCRTSSGSRSFRTLWGQSGCALLQRRSGRSSTRVGSMRFCAAPPPANYRRRSAG